MLVSNFGIVLLYPGNYCHCTSVVLIMCSLKSFLSVVFFPRFVTPMVVGTWQMVGQLLGIFCCLLGRRLAMLLLAFVLLPPIELLLITLQALLVEGISLFVCSLFYFVLFYLWFVFYVCICLFIYVLNFSCFKYVIYMVLRQILVPLSNKFPRIPCWCSLSNRLALCL